MQTLDKTALLRQALEELKQRAADLLATIDELGVASEEICEHAEAASSNLHDALHDLTHEQWSARSGIFGWMAS